MWLIIGIAAVGWLAILALALGLCAAARRGDAGELRDPGTVESASSLGRSRAISRSGRSGGLI